MSVWVGWGFEGLGGVEAGTVPAAGTNIQKLFYPRARMRESDTPTRAQHFRLGKCKRSRESPRQAQTRNIRGHLPVQPAQIAYYGKCPLL